MFLCSAAFSGRRSRKPTRTELIFLITPHVIRNRSEGTAVTEEFKSKLSTLRNDLERMRLNRERDLEKMKRDWQDQQQLQQQQQQQPAAPVPPTEPPSPSPSSSPARPTPITPLRNISVVPLEAPSTAPSPEPQTSIGSSSLRVGEPRACRCNRHRRPIMLRVRRREEKSPRRFRWSRRKSCLA